MPKRLTGEQITRHDVYEMEETSVAIKQTGIHNQPAPEVEEQDEKSPFLERLSNVRDKLKLGQHHTIERFSILFGVSAVSLTLITGVAFTQNRIEMSRQSTETAMVSSDFSFSLSGQTGVVQGVYGDEANTDVFVLIRFNDVSSMSLDASKYELFITGQKGETEPSKVSFSLFGATGYGIIRFQDEDGLENQLLDVVLRANTTLADKGAGTDGSGDSSFANFDQARIYVNPGADGIGNSTLAVGESSPSVLYTALVAEAADNEVRGRIATATGELKTLIARADEYKNRLVSSGYIAPPTPWFVEGDYIDERGELVPATYVPGAHELNYSDVTLRDGYVNTLVGDLEAFAAYIDEKDAFVPAKDAPTINVEMPTELEQQDGSPVTLDKIVDGKSPSSQVAAKSALSSLISTWRTYGVTKERIQKDMTRELLVIDADVLSQPDMYSSNEDVATFY